MTIRKQLFFASLAVLLLVFVAAITLSHHQLKKDLTLNNKLRLSKLADVEKAHVQRYLSSILTQLLSISSRTELRLKLQQWNSNPLNSQRSKIMRIIDDAQQGIPTILNIYVYDNKLNLVASTGKTPPPSSVANSLRSENSDLKPTVIPFIEGQARQLFAMSSLTLSDDTIGYLLVENRTDDLERISQNHASLGATAEMMIAVRTADGFMSYLFGPTLMQTNVTSEAKNVSIMSDALDGKESFFADVKDYRNKYVFAVTRFLPKHGWGLVIKIDQDEALATVRSLQSTTFGLVLLTFIVAGLIGFFNLQLVLLPVKRMRKALRQVADGDLQHVENVKGADEISKLVTTFNSMVTSIEQREQEMKATITHALDAIITIDQKGLIQGFNPAAERIFQFNRKDVIHKPMAELIIPKRYRGKHNAGIKRYLETGASQLLNRRIELSALDSHGNEFPVELTITSFKVGEEYRFTSFVRDLREVKAFEKVEKQLAAIVEGSSEAIIGKDLDGYIQSWNNGAEKVYGYTSEEAIGEHIRLIVPPNKSKELDRIMDSLCKGQVVKSFETKRLHKDGRLLDMLVTISPIKDSENNTVGAASIALDLTKQKLLEKDIIAAQKKQLRLKDEILSHVSHELRTPLAVIHQYVSIMTDGIGGELNKKQQSFMATIQRNVDQLQNMISDLMEVARSRSGKLTIDPDSTTVSDLVRMAKEEMGKQASDKNIKLKTSKAKKLPRVFADKSRVLQILSNLIGNSLAHTHENGLVEISAKVFEEDERFVCIGVRDNGSGIPPDELNKIFDRLYQPNPNSLSSRKGLGLGLTIARDLVRLHGGSIWADSELGKFTEVKFTLPVYSLKNIIESHLEKQQINGRELHILRIEWLYPTSLSDEIKINQARREIETTVQRGVLPQKDLILKGSHLGDHENCLYVLAQTNELGARSMMERVLSTLESSVAAKQFEVKFRITSNPIKGSQTPLGGNSREYENISILLGEIENAFEDQKGI